MMSAAAARRSASSHQGVRDGVSSGAGSSCSSRSAGKDCRFGAGGVTRSSHQRIGSSARAVSSQGAAKAMGPRVSIR